MNKEEALEIICMIADGLNPYIDKEPFKNPPEVNPSTTRALCIAIASLVDKRDKERLSSKYHRKTLAELIRSANGPLKSYLENKEKEEIYKAIYNSGYDVKKGAEFLGIELTKLKEKMEEYSLSALILSEKFFDENMQSAGNFHQFIKKLQEDIIREALFKSKFNRHKAAEILGIGIYSFRYKLNNIEMDFSGEYPKTNYLESFRINSLNDFIKSVEKEIIIKALKMNKFRKTKTAGVLGISPRSLSYKINIHGIESLDRFI